MLKLMGYFNRCGCRLCFVALPYAVIIKVFYKLFEQIRLELIFMINDAKLPFKPYIFNVNFYEPTASYLLFHGQLGYDRNAYIGLDGLFYGLCIVKNVFYSVPHIIFRHGLLKNLPRPASLFSHDYILIFNLCGADAFFSAHLWFFEHTRYSSSSI